LELSFEGSMTKRTRNREIAKTGREKLRKIIFSHSSFAPSRSLLIQNLELRCLPWFNPKALATPHHGVDDIQ
jgi:hypothetical protein